MNEIENIKILYIKDLMECMHIGRDKAYALMRNKSFPSTKIGRTYFVTQNNLIKWLNDNAGRDFTI
jgi:hypothetical protein